MDKCSMLYWWPLVKEIGIPVPHTEIIEIPHGQDLKILDDMNILRQYTVQIRKIADKLKYPLFFRTDITSGKHQWLETCFIADEQTLIRNMFNTIEFGYVADILGLPCHALVFREFLECDYQFKAFNSMPITKERRLFVRDGVIECSHPYWPEEAIENADTEDWKELLDKTNTLCETDDKILKEFGEKACKSVGGGYWSIDFLYTKHGWTLIDMAEGICSEKINGRLIGRKSYHWESCAKSGC